MEQLDFPIVYGMAKKGIAKLDPEDTNDNIYPLLDTIIEKTKCYEGNENDPVQLQVSSLAYDEYLGRMGIGRITKGKLKSGMNIAISKNDGTIEKSKIGKLYTNEGITRKEVQEAY